MADRDRLLDRRRGRPRLHDACTRRGAASNGRLALGTSGYALMAGASDPAWVGFLQSGTGAVTRTWNAKVADIYNVADFGPIGQASDSAVFQLAINAVAAASGGVVLIPAGTFAVSGLTLPGNVILRGAGKFATTLQSWYVDANVLTISGNAGGVEHLTIFGKGVNNDTGALGAASNALVVGGVENVIRSIRVWGGNYAIYVTGTDNSFYDLNTGESYSNANVATVGANWYIRCKFDHVPVGGVTDLVPFAAWAATTAYTVGKVRTTGGYALCCTVGGTSGGSAPTVKNYGINITDGSVTWQLLAPSSYNGFLLGAGAAENHFYQCDFSSAGYSNSIAVLATGSPAVSAFTDCVISSPIVITSGTLTTFNGCELAGSITINGGYTGRTIIQGNSAVNASAINVLVGANVNDFIIANNFFNGGTITVTAGTSTRYRITNNPNCIISDSGTGADRMPAAFTNSVVSPITMTTQNTVYDGPSAAQGSTGTWFASGTITVTVPAAGGVLAAKLWDGTTIIRTLAPARPTTLRIRE